MIFVDTNYFARFLLKDIEPQHQLAKELFLEAARDQISLRTSLVVFFELSWILESGFSKDKEGLSDLLYKILTLPVDFPDKGLLFESIYLFRNTSLELEDCYNLIFSQKNGIKDFKTFDQKLQKQFVLLSS